MNLRIKQSLSYFYLIFFFLGRNSVSKIHATAIVEKEVELGKDVEIGAYSVVRGNVRIGDRCVIMDHAAIYGNLVMGNDNIVHPGAVLGDMPQDVSYKGEPTWVIIGDNNTLREYVTINRASTKCERKTIIGNNNLIMAYSHIAHDCVIGNNNLMPNGSMLSGHVTIGDHVHTGGLTGVHQFVTIGSYSFIGFSSRIIKDVPPYIIVEGNPTEPRTINQIGLQRNGFSEDDISLLKRAFKVLYVSKMLFPQKIKALTAPPFSNNAHVQNLTNFVIASAQGSDGRAMGKK